MVNIFETLKTLDELEANDIVTLTYEEGTDVFHFNETEIDTALSETDVVSQLAELIATPGLKAKDGWSEIPILDNLREAGLLDDYERDSYDFDGHCIEKIKENPYDFCDFLDFSTEQYDHKRGYTTLTATLYTTVDAYGIRVAINPLAFIVWFFLFDSLSITPYAIYRWSNLNEKPKFLPLAIRGAAGGVVAFFSFGSIMLATRLDKVGEAAVLRETSTVFAALIGWLFLKETVGPRRVLLMTLIALGAVVVEVGG